MATVTSTNCSVCESQYIVKTAVKWCFKCDEAFCPDCLKYHSNVKLTKGHAVIDVSNLKELPEFVLKINQHCEDHGALFQNYCLSHERPCCRKCINLTHKNCVDMPPLDDVIKDARKSTAVEDIQERLQNLKECYKGLLHDGKIYCTNIGCPSVQCYNGDRTLVWDFKDQALIGRRGIAVDKSGIVYVGNQGGGNVIIASPDGSKYKAIKINSIPSQGYATSIKEGLVCIYVVMTDQPFSLLQDMADATSTNCTVCEAQSDIKAAVKWCSECEETFCFDCLKYHSNAKSTKGHAVIDVSDQKELPDFVLKIKQHCGEHGALFQNYCLSHARPCCRKCINSTHKNCIDMPPLDEVIKYVSKSAAVEDIQKRLRNLKEYYERLC
ncbi:unnamed protein product [Mytilus edulis]|uniref:B box-type domain-containing protein n=1 Tax=Mytilus edulis TaxID=6550 RepID=A0A8S3UIT2_MYTED|nr:unnamed protein product [Mytilus edulis]